MSTYKCKMTVIVPVYNVSEYLAGCLDSLVNQTIAKEELEVLLINDGSTDDSEAICQQYVNKHPYMYLFSKENEGQSVARNLGLQHASGKYIMFLDSDDKLTPETIAALVSFFDSHYDEVDLVTYRIQRYKEGVKLPLHYRYTYLQDSDVYDLNIFPYITQTTMNVCTKNRFADNVLFDVRKDFRHEDQKYCTDLLLDKMKIGYCSEGEYMYNRNNENSTVSTYFYAYYIFESTMRYYEELFGRYPDSVPPYIQATFVNDINWKLVGDILFPYHYNDADFAHAMERIRALLCRIDDETLLNHPSLDVFHMHYFLNFKQGEPGSLAVGAKDFAVLRENTVLFSGKRIEVYLTKIKCKNDKMHWIGFLKSPVFSYTEKPTLLCYYNGRLDKPREIALSESSWGHYKSKVKTNQFWTFTCTFDLSEMRSIELQVLLEGHAYDTYYVFSPESPLQPKHMRSCVFTDTYAVSHQYGKFLVEPRDEKEYRWQQKSLRRYYFVHGRKFLLVREFTRLKRKKKKRIWIYSDCENVLKDNAYYQFQNDFYKDDGVERYYTYNDTLDRSALFDQKQQKHLIRFRSWKHKLLFLQAEKIITAFIEPTNYLPYFTDAIPHYADYMDFDLIYLQHGVLHAHMPWKYSLDRLNLDKEVISTHFERENLLQNYCFREENLIPSGMPRYDHIDKTQPAKNKILFAPSWRKYLVSYNKDGKWVSTEEKFLASDFYKETQAFLNSAALHAVLEKYDYTLDFKLHPIFRFYSGLYQLSSPRVRVVEGQVNEFEYAVFITDFSSFVFDFAYLQRPILYMVPDEDLFLSGMNAYRELDLPLREGLGPLTATADEATAQLEAILARGCKAEEQYAKKMDGFFFDVENRCEAIYQALTEESH